MTASFPPFPALPPLPPLPGLCGRTMLTWPLLVAVWGWALNLHCFYRLKVDVPALIRYPARTSPHHSPHHLSTYRLAYLLSSLFAISICLFWLLTWHVPARVIAYDWLPLTYLLALFAVFLAPLRRGLPDGGRRRFLRALRRVSIGGIAEAQDGKFGDILLADALTSYAKVCGDLYVMVCMAFGSAGSSTKRPNRNCGGTALVPLLLAVPSLIRLRQCLTEYLRVRRAPYKESVGWGGQHLANALKYSSAFPVILASSLQRNARNESSNAAMNTAWLVAVMVNSLYSFYWDVAKDWDLSMFSSRRERNLPHQPWGLRERRIFQPIGLYYAVVALDLILRCTWSMKLSPHLIEFSEFESGIFLIEFLEVFRRWMWVFLRVEAEWLRNNTSGLGTDDILLSSMQGKYEDED